MLVNTALGIASSWVKNHAAHFPGFIGAYFTGSTVNMSPDALLPHTSDIDIMLVLDIPTAPLKPGKFIHRGVLLEVSLLEKSLLCDPETVLSNYHLANGFRVHSIILDPSGFLTQLYQTISPQFASKLWVQRRCQDVRAKITGNLSSLDLAVPFHDLTTAWLFSTGITTHMVLVAALRNPTVRTRYPAARSVLSDYGMDALYEQLLDLLGCQSLPARRVREYLCALEEIFSDAAHSAHTPFFFSSDITEAARPISIDGSRELIDSGLHREAVFWIFATFCRCLKILASDAPELYNKHQLILQDMLIGLGVAQLSDFSERAGEVLAFLPTLENAAYQIIDRNPLIH